MSIIKKIKWRRGMEITPAVFEAVDLYNADMNRVAYQAASCERYGLFPNESGNIVSTIEDGQLHIVASPIMALTRSGCIIHSDAIDKKFLLPKTLSGVLYITMIEEGEDSLIINDTLFATPKYSFECKNLSDIDSKSVAIAKISFERGQWKIDKNYITPVISIKCSGRLVDALQKFREDITIITNTLTEKNYLESPSLLHILNAELNVYDGNESPKALWVLLHKITTCLSGLNLDSENMPPISLAQNFNNDDICLSLLCFDEYLSGFVRFVKDLEGRVGDKPIVRIIKPKSQDSNNPEPEVPEYDPSYIKI